MTQEQSENVILTVELLQEVLNNMDTGIIIADPLGNFILWNNKADEMFEKEISRGLDFKSAYKVETVEGEKVESDFTPMGIAINGGVVDKRKLCVKGGKNPKGIYVEVSSKPLMDKDGKIRAAMVELKDITKAQIFWKNFVSKLNEIDKSIIEKLGVDYTMLRQKYYIAHHP